MRNVTHSCNICPVPQATREKHLGTRPSSVPFFNTQMHSAAVICPHIVAVVQIIQSAAIARNGANFPIVPTEMNRLGRCQRNWPNAFYSCDSDEWPSQRRKQIHGGRGLLSRFYY